MSAPVCSAHWGRVQLLLCGATFKFPKFVDSRDFGLRAGVPQSRSRWPTGFRPGQGPPLGIVIEGRSKISVAPAGKTTARAPQSGRFLGIYAWFQSRCTSVRGTSRPRAAAPVHNPHNFTGLLSRVNTVHSSDPACVPGNPAEWVCEYAPFRSFCGHSARGAPSCREGSTRV